MDCGVFEICVAISILSLCTYYYFKLYLNYWKKFKVISPTPRVFFGNIIEVFFGKINMALLIQRYYNEYKSEKLIGIYALSTPKLIVKDLDLIKNVLIKHFNAFSDRGVHIPKDPFEQSLVNLKHDDWKVLRNALTPTFTSSKLKEMFYLMENCASRFEKYLENVSESRKPIECRELTAKYTTEIIGTCAFGQEFNALDDENNQFRNFGRASFSLSLLNVLRRFTREFMPKLYDRLPFIQKREGSDFFIKSITELMEYRNNNNVKRNDFVDILRDLKYKSNELNKIGSIELSNRFLTGQAFIFFVAGFETSSTTMSNAFYELAQNPHIQDKLRQEIRDELKNNNGKLTSDMLKRMTYLDKVVKEALRKYPPIGYLQRKATTSYTFDDTNVTIPKGTGIYIPVWAIHRDPDIYPHPDIYDPERFSEENIEQRHPMSFLSFGQGPHNCIGGRFAYYQTKVGIIATINKFKLTICEKTIDSYKVEPRSIITGTPVGGIYLTITKA